MGGKGKEDFIYILDVTNIDWGPNWRCKWTYFLVFYKKKQSKLCPTKDEQFSVGFQFLR